ncbi:carboxypeptidase-like regulatory domain-containing protein [Aestuariibaculum sediminum]|uniref:Carboxypeptidase regulatory-like domain-containing protein n=1 Tax=Aestuariibaculum sediminum TaxID=2770637 RepID=A0A8J6UEY1_9FLAO|nr:carboxypeptidase-like regulatory domain-containing protein [Aestuariibaculum sediminum]MBD0831121.1 carboxypeptidase regulatory-like domain-containing protein [Aestuariibaculum sediminum]
MKNYAFLVFAIVLWGGCSIPQFEPNARVLIKGKVLDENNAPILDAKVTAYIFREDYYLQSYFLGSDLSAQDGGFQITSLLPKNEEYVVEVKSADNYTEYYYLSNTFENNKPDNYTINLEAVQLKKNSKVNYTITRTSPLGTTLHYSFNFPNVKCYEYFENGQINPENSNCFDAVYISRFLDDNNPNDSSFFWTVLGSVVEFRYVINDGPEVVETFIIDEENYEFEFSY